MARTVVHPKSAKVARDFAREELGMRKPKLRVPTKGERVRAHAVDPNNAERVNDIVVAKGADGCEALLYIDLDPSESRHLKRESALLTATGLVPLLGKPTVLYFALRDIVVGGLRCIKDKMAHGHVDPKDRAILQMGLKHLGLTTASYATGGVAHVVVVAAECGVVGHDLSQGHKDRHILKAAGAALKGLLDVHEHPNSGDPASITVVRTDAEAPPKQAQALQLEQPKAGQLPLPDSTGPPKSAAAKAPADKAQSAQ